MHFTLFSISSLLVLTTFVYSAPTASLDSATLLNNALEAQRLNAQFRTATNNSTATASCTNGDTACVQGAIASCVNGQFDTSKGRCPGTQQCFALPSVNSSGTTITCTSKKSAHSLIKAAGAPGGVTGSGTGNSTNPVSASSTSSEAPPGTSTSMNAIIPTSTAINESIVTVTVTLIPSSTTTLPTVTQTLSPEQASSLLASLLAQGGQATTATSDGSDQPSETVSSTVSATAMNIPTATPDSNCPDDEPSDEVVSSTVPASATNISSPAPPSATTPAEIANNTGSPTSLGSGGYVSSTVSATATPDSNCPDDESSDEVISSTVPASATNISSPAPPSATTPAEIANNTGSPTSLGSGGYSSY